MQRVSSRRFVPGCCKYWWHHTTAQLSRLFGITILLPLHRTAIFSTNRVKIHPCQPGSWGQYPVLALTQFLLLQEDWWSLHCFDWQIQGSWIPWCCRWICCALELSYYNTNTGHRSSRLSCHLGWVHSPVMRWHLQLCCWCLWYTWLWSHILLRVISSGTLDQRSGLEHPALNFCGQCRPIVVPKACLWTLLVFPLWSADLVQSCFISVVLCSVSCWKMSVTCCFE